MINQKNIFITIIFSLSFSTTISAKVFTVRSPSDSNPKDFTTIQACSVAAKAGDTCLVYAGNYAEDVQTVSGGIDDAHRITFKANDKNVHVLGFEIKHPYVTIDGFDISGDPHNYSYILLLSGGNYCEVLNNRIHDGIDRIKGIIFYRDDIKNAVIRGNTLSSLRYTFLAIRGDNHLFENNIFEFLNSMDFIYLFGRNHTFRRNIFRNGNIVPGTGNHPDWLQAFYDNGDDSWNMLFEENWIEGLECQLAQLNSVDAARGFSNAIGNYTFRRNVFANVTNNMNVAIPGTTFENNTFYRMATKQFGIGIGGSMSRGDIRRTTIKNNVFLGGGEQPDLKGFKGFYGFTGQIVNEEDLGYNASFEPRGNTPIAKGIYDDLVKKGYLTSNSLFDKLRRVTDISQLDLDPAYTAYKPATYALLMKAVSIDTEARATSMADYNYAAGLPEDGFPKRYTAECVPGASFSRFSFCEGHGINGGDPKMQNLSNLLGPDGIPFTADDGLRPLIGSGLCSSGENGTNIGAYSCGAPSPIPQVSIGLDRTVVFPGTITLNASASDDGLPNPPATLTYSWKKMSGPGTVSFSRLDTLTTTLTFSSIGTYVVRLEASDSQNTGFDEVTISVVDKNQTNKAPVVSAGADFSVGITNIATLNGSGSDDGLPLVPGKLTLQWSKVSGPGTVTFGNNTAAITSARFSDAGMYSLSLTASDGTLSATDQVVVDVMVGETPQQPDPGSNPQNNGTQPSGISPFQNIFNPAHDRFVTIPFNTDRPAHVTIKIFDRGGEEIRTLFDQESGSASTIWEGQNAKNEIVSSGVYLIRMTIDSDVYTKKIVVVK